MSNCTFASPCGAIPRKSRLASTGEWTRCIGTCSSGWDVTVVSIAVDTLIHIYRGIKMVKNSQNKAFSYFFKVFFHKLSDRNLNQQIFCNNQGLSYQSTFTTASSGNWFFLNQCVHDAKHWSVFSIIVLSNCITSSVSFTS